MSESTILPYGELLPQIDQSVFVAPGAVVVGDVTIGQDSSVWFNAVIRGDVNFIRIGVKTNIQDNCTLHVTHDTHPLVIGNMVTVGHAVTLHGCTVEDLSLIGIGAVVLDGALIETNSFVAAGALVPPGMTVKSGTLVAGVPARVIRELRPEEIADLPASANRYVANAAETRRSIG